MPGAPAVGTIDGTGARARGRERHRRAALTALGLIGARGVGAVTAIVTVPLAVSYLGAERYGIWVTISSLVAFLAFTDVGLGSALVTAVADASGRGDRRGVSRLVSSATWTLVVIAVVLASVVGVSTWMVDWGGVFNARSELARSEADLAMLAFGLCFAASLPLTATTQVRLGLQEGYLSAAFTAAGNVLGLVLAIVAIALQAGLPVLVLAFMGGPLLASVANAVALFARDGWWLAPSPSRVDRVTVGGLLATGSQFLVLQVAMAIGFYTQTFIAVTLIGPIAAAEYGVVSRLFLVPTVIVSAALAALWPAYSEALAAGDRDWIRATARRSLLLVIGITVPAAVVLTVAGPLLVDAWTLGEVDPPLLLIAGMAAWTILSGIGSAVAVLLNAMRALGLQIASAIVMAAASAALSVLLALHLGVSGVILGLVIAYPVTTLLPMAVYVPGLLRRVLPPTANGRT